MVFVSTTGESSLLQAEEGMPIGVIPDVVFSNYERQIGDGDCFAIYSDGVTEARDRKRAEFGTESLSRSVKEKRQFSSKEISEKIVKELECFVGRAPQHDDITLIVIKAAS